MDWTTTAVGLQLALFLYFEVHEWVPLHPWNDMSHGNPAWRVALVLGLVQIGVMVGFSREWILLMIPGALIYVGWLWLQLDGWWKPYLFGTTERKARAYEKYFGTTHRFLPAIADHPIPNTAHVLLQVLVIAVVVSSVAAIVEVI